MTEKELINKEAEAVTKMEEKDRTIANEAKTFSEMDKRIEQEVKCVETCVQPPKSVKDIEKDLKKKLSLKKVENICGEVAVVSDANYRMGVVTIDGKIIVPFGKYGWIGPYREDGTAPVRDGTRFSSSKEAKWGAIDKFGEEVVPIKHKNLKGKYMEEKPKFRKLK